MKKFTTKSYACTKCRKTFKKRAFAQDKKRKWSPTGYSFKCTNCGNIMFEAGTAFKAPKQSDKKQWQKIEVLLLSGYKFNAGYGNPFKK
ncbi:MAG: hypothetical protein D6B27_11230 [Gammaproteobacteria bacterium]|nr:MAG: hypothetical protein D6B27_11230 [Gammaproteobacteria bacterium]